MGLKSQYIGAIDQGTTSTRFIIFNSAGRIVSSHQLEHNQIYPEQGYVEHSGSEILEKTHQTIKAAMEKASASAEDFAAIGITNQRETTIAWNKKDGKPYYNAIVWQDTRTAEFCSDLSSGKGQYRFAEKTGLPLATYFSGPKIRWILDNIPGVKEAAMKGEALFGNMDTWLIWNLTGGPDGGVHATDVTNASRTMLMNLKTLDWDDEMLEIIGIPRNMLPEINPSSRLYGTTKKNGPFGGCIPISGDLGDQHAALFGQTCFNPGEAKNTYGTGCFLLLNTGTTPVFSKNGLLTTVGYKIGGEKAVYALEGSVAVTGALVQWLRDNLGIISSSPQINELACSVNDNGGVYFVPAFSGLFAPYWKSDARGLIIGLTRYANKGHLARASLEATAFQVREVFEAMEKDSGIKLTELKADGGMVASELLMQFQADMLNVPVIRPKVTETTALGAAYAAGLSVGFWNGKQDLKSKWEIDKKWQPSLKKTEREKTYRLWKKAVKRTFGWI